MIGWLLPPASQFQFMALAVDIKDGHGPSNEMHHQLQLKKTKVTLYKLLI